MNCPRCNVKLVPTAAADVTYESCPECSGKLLDRGELDRLAEPHEGDLEFSTLAGETFSHEDTFGVTDCPKCVGVAMRKVEFNIYTGIILDNCERCGAFWLDGKELDRINEEVRQLDSAPDSGPAPAMLWFANFIWSLPR